ncbi:hypothetical protein B0H16DRAFT_1884300 [Mycena metata]|uniref:Uncharacterized protein n=1 Tax=Mycena metata TaxID=1033252 RepID=A0AAD7JCM7_9AGAR|nr:hypothetical protein B0H16DRAFT_1884300 [Mycena metata]
MHRCWKVPELTSMIFACFGPIKHPYDYPPQLEDTAPSKTQYWPDLPGILEPRTGFTLGDAVWDYTPPAMFTHRHLDGDDGSFTIQSVVKVKDWDRVLAYARRIRHLTIVDADIDMPLHQSALESVDVNADPYLFPYLRFLLGPQLLTANVDFCGPVWRLGILQLLATRSPSLTSICLFEQGSFPLDDLTESVSSFVMSWLM